MTENQSSKSLKGLPPHEENREARIAKTEAQRKSQRENNIESKRNFKEDRCLGVLLGGACGDALGAGCEMMSAELIKKHYDKVRDYIQPEDQHFGDYPPRPAGHYTDDTEMSLALANSLIEMKGEVDATNAGKYYGEYVTLSRGYGRSTTKKLKLIAEGGDPLETGMMFPPRRPEGGGPFLGSSRNGGAMRISPVGVVASFQNWSDEKLQKAVKDALLPTHCHPNAIDGALLQAKAVQVLTGQSQSEDFDPKSFLDTLSSCPKTDELRQKLEYVAKNFGVVSEREIIEKIIGKRGVEATEASSCSICCFLHHFDEPEEGVITAVGFGRDCDTIAAMTACLFGALKGSSWIPERWRNELENGTRGRDFIYGTAKRLSIIP